MVGGTSAGTWPDDKLPEKFHDEPKIDALDPEIPEEEWDEILEENFSQTETNERPPDSPYTKPIKQVLPPEMDQQCVNTFIFMELKAIRDDLRELKEMWK